MSETLERSAAAPVHSAPGASDDVARWLAAFETALAAGDVDAATGLFTETSFWRDLVAFTWNLKTVEGRAGVRSLLEGTLEATKPTRFRLDGEASEADGLVEGWFTFETAAARGFGHIRLKGKLCWTLLTTMRELKGFEEKKGRAREKGVHHGAEAARKSWLERKEEEEAKLGYETQPYVVIVGGGQGGIGLAARLKRLGVPTVIIEKNERPGDSWRKRYKSLHLHDPVWYDHLPYLPFPDDWPVFAAKDKIGDWLEHYTRIMELNFWGSSTARSAAFDEASGEWTVVVDRDGQEVVLHPRQLVMATGLSGKANKPRFPGMETFKGDQHHSSEHPGPDAWTGKRAVVIGSNNSAHDISAALWEAGADVTMVQRTSTHIARSDSLMELSLGGLYSEDAVERGITTDKADLIFASVPYRIMPDFHVPVYEAMKARDADFYARLEKAGFLLDFGEDGSGLFMKYLRRGSGYYIDVGASELVADGKIKLKSGVGIAGIREHSVAFDDGTELPADLIVYATGYASMNGWVADLMGQDAADRVGKCWGMGSGTTKDPGPWVGELRNMWKPTALPNLWFHGGNLHQSRHYSQFLSLQLKARMEGLDTPVWGQDEVHHTS
ncbi:NAD(P)/FAD-dependent oxidoreductase [Aureimonas sp. AU12]|uniref:NAD(P)/FAD-dependent oxidoreductase n=1 Tax=Aureimonas sp. AU12 TaxID=1638161 RepID=UPI0009E8212D|nr:NAD(P)/FAD-dependent oxidoreductase [Aureimonas sp. AU12]